MSAKVVPIGDAAAIVHLLANDISESARDMPAADLLPGYRVLPETTADFKRLIPLMEEASRILGQALEREGPRFQAFSDQLEAAQSRPEVQS